MGLKNRKMENISGTPREKQKTNILRKGERKQGSEGEGLAKKGFLRSCAAEALRALTEGRAVTRRQSVRESKKTEWFMTTKKGKKAEPFFERRATY